jgi:zona occludens toxin (predicted ATPase)
MPSSFRHLIAIVLLALLPLQAIAAVYAVASAPIVACSDEMMAMGCCEHDDDAGAACQASACFASAALAPPLAWAECITPVLRSAVLPSPSDIYTSYVSDGPQRPPRTHS